MIKLTEEGMSRADVAWKLGFLHELAKYECKGKKFLKEIKNATLVNT